MLSSTSARLWTLFLLFASARTHPDTPPTPEQVKAYSDLQAASYLCAPAIAEFTAERQRAFAQKVLAGQTGFSSLGAEELFPESEFETESQQKLLSCHPAADTKIKNNTCILAPISTQGPYYEQNAHPIRSNIAEYELGLLSLYNIGVIDVNTCEPVPNVLVDIWQANATGHYSQHPIPHPDFVDERPQTSGKRKGLLSPFPRTNEWETFGRGAWPTDKNGVAAFTSIFPGYYTGRATHVHVKVHPEWTPHPNGTFTSGRVAHVGQFFFEDKLNMAVDKLWPYNTNPVADKWGRTRNWDDGLRIFHDAHVGGYNSIMDTYLLGGVLQQGLVSYITMTVNMSFTVTDLIK